MNFHRFGAMEVTKPYEFLGFLIHGCGAGQKSLIFWVWAAPAAPNTIPEGGGLRPPPSWGAAGAGQTPNIDDFRPAPKPCVKNPSVLGGSQSVSRRPLLGGRVYPSPGQTL
jgi:hypothetical protein